MVNWLIVRGDLRAAWMNEASIRQAFDKQEFDATAACVHVNIVELAS